MQATAQYDNARTSAYVAESTLSPRNVNATGFGKIATINVDGDVYAQVLYVPAVKTLYIATEHNSVYAFDPQKPAAPLWQVNLGTPLPGFDTMCPFIRPEVGITPTPVIDTTTGTIYVLARTKEHGTYVQRLHALSIATGQPRHAPVEIHATVPGSGAGSLGGVVRFDPLRENPRAALLLTKGKVILSWASSCDVGPFHGWVMAYDARTLAQTAVFNVTPDGDDGGVWQGDAGLAADAQGHIYVATSNGTFDAATGGRDYGDSMLELTLGASGFSVTDYFTPSNQRDLDENDLDLGSGGPLLLPDHYVFIGGKGGGVYVLDRNNLGKLSSQGTRTAPSMVMGAAAYWNNHVYTLWSSDVIKMFGWSNGGGHLSDGPVSQGTHKFTDPGATPTISAHGTTNGIVWVVETKTWNGRDRHAVLHAYDAANVATELYSSEMNAERDRAGLCTRFNIVTVANGRVYVGAKGEVDVYGLIGRR